MDVGSIKQIELDIGIEPAAILILLSSRWLHCQLYKHWKTSKLWLVGKWSFWCPNSHQKNIMSLSFTKVPPDYWVISANFWELLRGPLPHQAEVSLPNTLFIIAFPISKYIIYANQFGQHAISILSWRIQPMKPRFLIPWRVTFEKKAGWNPYPSGGHLSPRSPSFKSDAFRITRCDGRAFPQGLSHRMQRRKSGGKQKVGWVNFLKDVGREKTLTNQKYHLDFWIHDHLARASNDVSSFKWIEACYHFRHLRIYLSNYLIVPCLIYLVHLHYLYLHLIIVKVDESRLSFQHMLNMNQPLWSPGAFNFHRRRPQLVEVPMMW